MSSTFTNSKSVLKIIYSNFEELKIYYGVPIYLGISKIIYYYSVQSSSKIN